MAESIPLSRTVIQFYDAPITKDNFFVAPYYRHIKFDEKDTKIETTELPENAKPSLSLIKETEVRLGITFPTQLKSLYMLQNGGSVGDLWVPIVHNLSQYLDDWRGVFSHDYCHLVPLKELETLHDVYLYAMTEDEIAKSEYSQKDAKRYVLLSIRCADATFLDYSQSSCEPKVGVIDFEGIDKNDVWFDTFDDFFAALKRGELDCENEI